MVNAIALPPAKRLLDRQQQKSLRRSSRRT
jgi:hypothetical protein